MNALPKPPKRPCGSCPYRQDVPSGVWEAHEYLKLPDYDGDVPDQLRSGAWGVFMCHQRDGCLCAGWLACHGSDNLLALRLQPVDPSAYGYTTDVPVWSSGREACLHGIKEIANPGPDAQRLIDKVGSLIKEKET